MPFDSSLFKIRRGTSPALASLRPRGATVGGRQRQSKTVRGNLTDATPSEGAGGSIVIRHIAAYGVPVNSGPVLEKICDGIPAPRRYLAILAVSAGTALAVIDGTIANVALPTIARVLEVPSSKAVLVVTVYQLLLVMTLLPFSALGDRIGHRRLYQWGQILFIAATLFCFFATSLPLLLMARAFQAVGAAAALSVSSALLRSIYPARQLGRGLGINSMIVAGSAALAPTLGGAILAVGPWQWVFAAAIPFALLSLAVGHLALPRAKGLVSSYDHVGALLSAAAFGLVILGLQGLVYGQHDGLSLLETAAGCCAAAILVRQQTRVPRPIIPLDLLQQARLAVSVLGLLLAFMAQMMLLVSLPFRMQHGFGFTPIEVGAVLSLWPLTMMVVSPVAGAMSDRISSRLLGGLGMAVATLGLVSMALLPEGASHIDAGLRMVICGLGFGLFLAPNARVIIGTAPRDRAAAAGGMMATTRLTGQTLGASFAGGLLALGLGDGPLPASVAAGATVVIGLLSLCKLRRTSQADAARI